VPSLFKRKPSEAEVEPDAVAEPDAEPQRPKGYTPSKRELGKTTPKRREVGRRRPSEAAPANRKEAAKRAREKARQDRAERRAAMMAGDERYLLPRDKGPERALVRDIVDKRLTIGTWFFGGALLVLIGSSRAMPPVIQVTSNLLWALLAVATVLDSILLGREIKRQVRARYPKSEQRMGSLYLYGAMRGLTFRRLRIPKPRVKLGARL
jgi:Protein of unknown function (DUF3043)